MSNFNAIHRGYIGAVVEPFLPGRAANIIPIAYEALSPDTFVFLFTVREDDTDKYYVAYEVDYIDVEDMAINDVEQWTGATVIEAVKPTSKQQAEADLFVYIDDIYKVYMYEVTCPNKAYWQDVFTIRTAEDIEKYLPTINEKTKEKIREILESEDVRDDVAVRTKYNGNLDIVYNRKSRDE